MARYITHQANWGAVATTSVREPIVGFPFANIFSVSDGPVDHSSGVPYLYISPWEISAHDLKKDNKASLTMSLAQVSNVEVDNFWKKFVFRETSVASITMTQRTQGVLMSFLQDISSSLKKIPLKKSLLKKLYFHVIQSCPSGP